MPDDEELQRISALVAKSSLAGKLREESAQLNASLTKLELDILAEMDSVVERFRKFHLEMRRKEGEIERHVEFLEQRLLTRAEVAQASASSNSSKWFWPFMLLLLLMCIGGFVCFRQAHEVLSKDQWFYTNRATSRKSRWVD
eukprot:g4826.t1